MRMKKIENSLDGRVALCIRPCESEERKVYYSIRRVYIHTGGLELGLL